MKKFIITIVLSIFVITAFSQSGVVRKTQIQKTDTLATHIEYLNWIDFIEAYGGGGGGTPGGSDTQVQFNDGGSFGGDSAFVWDKTNDKLTVAGDILSDRYLTEAAATQSTSGTIDFDTRTNADHTGITLTGNSTLRINYVEDGQSGQVDIFQDATGSRTLEVNVYTDNATTAITEYYSGGLENISPDANTLTEIYYKRQGSKVKISLVWYVAE